MKNALRLFTLLLVASVAASNVLGDADAPIFYRAQAIDVGLDVPNNGWPIFLAADVDNDGHADLITYSEQGEGIIVNRSTGSSFRPPIALPTNGVPVAVAVADFNGDGNQDLVYANATELRTLLGNGDGTFLEGPSSADPNHGSMVVGDFNGDGRIDVATERDQHPYADDLALHFGDGTGAFASPFHPTMSGVSVRDLVAGDFNEDGKSDLALVGNSLSVYLGGASRVVSIRDLDTSVNEVAVADLNGDQHADLLIIGLNDTPGVTELQSFRGTGTGSFFKMATQYGIGFPNHLQCADVDGDGVEDAVNAYYGVLSVWRGNDDGTFAPPLFSRVDTDSSYTLADFDHDGHKDVVAFSILLAGYDYEVSLVRGNGDGTFGRDRGYSIDSWAWAGAGPFAEDMNLDGFPDLTMLVGRGFDPIEMKLVVLLNDGTGKLLPAIETPVVSVDDERDLVIGFLDGDEVPDALVITDTDAHAYFGNGHGSFMTGPVSPLGETDGGPARLVEFTGDGNVDLIQYKRLYIGDGNGSFALANGPGLRVDTLADVDENGLLDVIGMDLETFTIRLALNQGGGVFAPSTQLLINTPATAADLDGDGHVDLISPIWMGIETRRGHGDGTFDPPITTSAGFSLYPSPMSIDLNEDGAQDVIGAGFVAMGNGDGRIRSVEKGFPARPFAMADYDRNGVIDAVTITEHVAFLHLGGLPLHEPRRPSTTTITPSHTPEYGWNVDYVAEATDGDTLLTGRFAYYEDGLPVAVNDSGVRASHKRMDPFGDYTLTAKFLGSDTHLPSSSTLSYHIDRGTTTLQAVSPGGVYGEDTSVEWELRTDQSAYVDGGPTTFRFSVNETSLPVSAYGFNTASVRGLEAGTHTVKLSFLGSDLYKPSETTFPAAVEKRTPVTQTSVSPAGSLLVAGGDATMRLTFVQALYGTTTGTVTVTYDAQSFGTFPIVADVAEWIIPSVTAGDHTVAYSYDGDSNHFSHAGSFQFSVNANPSGPPISVTATMTGNQAFLQWTASQGAQSYRVFRRATMAGDWEVALQTTTQLQANFTSASGVTTMYAVAPIYGDGAVGPIGTPDIATSVAESDAPLTAGKAIRAIHLLELRTAANAIRAFAGLSAVSFTGTIAPGAPIRAIHFTEIRNAIAEARSAIGLSTSLSSPPVVGGPIRANHVEELRVAVR